jgi:hypothetical protein
VVARKLDLGLDPELSPSAAWTCDDIAAVLVAVLAEPATEHRIPYVN